MSVYQRKLFEHLASAAAARLNCLNRKKVKSSSRMDQASRGNNRIYDAEFFAARFRNRFGDLFDFDKSTPKN